MAIANLYKSEELVINTTSASKYRPMRHRICTYTHQWKAPLSDITSIKYSKTVFYEVNLT
jgi:hypothetical protein